MSQLLLIRHGQARFGTSDYDRLSDLGERQARLIGRHLAGLGQHFDALLAGDMRRQQRTAELAALAWDETPDVITWPAFNEYDADMLFRAYLPRVLEEDPALGKRHADVTGDRRLFQKAFEQITRHWLAGTPHDEDGGESWVEFRGRVHDALAKLHADYPRDARIGVFTSGGPIAVSVAAAVDSSAAKTIELNWSMYNASVSELRSTRSGWRLLGFNDISALRAAGDPDLISFR